MPEHTICATEVTQGLAGEGGKQKVRMLLVLCLEIGLMRLWIGDAKHMIGGTR